MTEILHDVEEEERPANTCIDSKRKYTSTFVPTQIWARSGLSAGAAADRRARPVGESTVVGIAVVVVIVVRWVEEVVGIYFGC